MAVELDLEYPSLVPMVRPFVTTARSESAAFLLWFLQNIYRLDEYEAQDAVCDGSRDKGIDGIYVDQNNERIDVLQAKIGKAAGKTIGDTSLREFAGTLSHFATPDSVRKLAEQTINADLKSLLASAQVADLMEKGYQARGVFVTNLVPDVATTEYLANEPRIELYDRSEIVDRYVPPGEPAVIEGPTELEVTTGTTASFDSSSATMTVAPIAAKELVQLPGIESGALFAWNVRQSLGRTKVNREISKSIADVSTHGDFALFHNGLTILAKDVEVHDTRLSLSHYTVVNGCQSLSSMYDQREHITEDLKVLVRVITIDPTNELAGTITHHSNNQNPINARDLQSNSSIQRRLQTDFDAVFTGTVRYTIKRGEQPDSSLTIDNDLAARIMLAFDLKEPWTCHQTYKLFDERHADIFGRKEVTARRIVALHSIYEAALDGMAGLEYENMSKYRLSVFFLLYILRRVMEETDDVGKEFCRSPDEFVSSVADAERIRSVVSSVVEDVLIDVNEEIRDRADSDSYFDYKRLLKSAKAVQDLAKSIVPQYQKGVRRDRATSFGAAWEKASPTGHGA